MKRLAIIAAVLLALVVTASAVVEAWRELAPRPPQSPATPRSTVERYQSPVSRRTAVVGALVAAQRLRGVASWYATPGLTGAAGPVLREALGGDPAFRGERVTVCSEACVTVTLTDWCACGERRGQPTLIDLSASAFRRLAPLSRGIVPVAVGLAVAARPTPPATSTEGETP